MLEQDCVFKFNDAVDYLNYMFEAKRLRNNRFSLRAWSRQLGYENPSFVSHILKKERNLKISLANKFINNLKLSGNSKKYFEVLVLLANSKTPEERKIYLEILESLHPDGDTSAKSLNLNAFRVISDWYHSAILELAELKDFQSDPLWIKKRLGDQVSLKSIIKAIERLVELELLERSVSGRLSRAKVQPIFLDSLVPSEAIRYFHTQMIEKAKSSIEEQSIDERDIRGSLISIRTSDYAKIQKIIKKAHADIVKYSCDGDGDELYHFNTQFFRITKKKELS